MYQSPEEEVLYQELRAHREARALIKNRREMCYDNFNDALIDNFREEYPRYGGLLDQNLEKLEEQIERLERDYLDLVQGEFRIEE